MKQRKKRAGDKNIKKELNIIKKVIIYSRDSIQSSAATASRRKFRLKGLPEKKIGLKIEAWITSNFVH